MNPVIQQDPTGCGLASVATLTGQTYATVKKEAAQLGIAVSDARLWSDPGHVRRLLNRFHVSVGNAEENFVSWSALPDRALLAVKWHREKSGPAWHWVVFVRDASGSCVLDPKKSLRAHRRTDFGRIKPNWFIRVQPTITEDYVSLATREFERMKQLADRALAQLPAERFFARPAPDDNSVGLIVKHVAGNLLSRWTDFLTSDGEKPGRHRDSEFIVLPDDSRASLLARWEAGWSVLFGALSPLSSSDLNRTVTIRGEALSVLQAINRQLTHYAYHVGQIVYVAKHFAGPQWKSLGIPLGKSEQFNRAPTPYRKKA